jgi:RNA polymerase sigma-70 factor (ECF subfamily)
MLLDEALAEDAVQDAFIRVIRKRHQYIQSEPFSSWFYAILRNVCIDMLRKRRRDQKLAGRLCCELSDRTVVKSASRELSLLDMLPSRERTVLELRVVHSMSFKEVAVALDISEEAAKKRAQRGLRKLRQKLSRAERRAV